MSDFLKYKFLSIRRSLTQTKKMTEKTQSLCDSFLCLPAGRLVSLLRMSFTLITRPVWIFNHLTKKSDQSFDLPTLLKTSSMCFSFIQGSISPIQRVLRSLVPAPPIIGYIFIAFFKLLRKGMGEGGFKVSFCFFYLFFL